MKRKTKIDDLAKPAKEAMVRHPWIAVAFDATVDGSVTIKPTWRMQHC